MTAQTTPRHQVSVATAHLRGIVSDLVDASVWSMDPVETATTLVELARLKAQVAELECRVAAHADQVGVGDHVGATSTANWLAHTTKQTRAAAHRTVAFGHDLETHTCVRDALATGRLVEDQARVILRAIKELPEDLDPALVVKAEEHLVGEAMHHDAKTLRILGRRLLEVVAPDLVDQHEADLLAKEEAKAAQACRLTMTDDGHGKTHGRFTIPTRYGAQVKKMLLALAAPKHQAATHGAGVERRPSPERMGQAFCELLDRISATDLPKVGGRDATIVVTIDYESLLGKVEKAGVLDTGEHLSPWAVRKLACAARILPVVLGGDSEVLDVGRAKRFFTKAQLTALGIRDGGCVTEGCDWPPWMCHAHHWQRWADEGGTDLHNGGLLCPRHHARAHDPTYEITHHPNGAVTFHRRT